MNAYLTLIRIDIRLAFRQKIVIFFNYLMPLAFFFIFAQIYRAEQGGVILQVVSMVIVIGILGNGLLGAGIRAAQEREMNILRRYKVAPISPLPLLVASSVTGLVVYMPSVLLILALAIWRYGMAMPRHPAALLIFVMLGVVAFRCIGLIVASVVNSMQENNILVQILYMAMLFLSGATIPTAVFPNWLLVATQFIPATWLMTGLQGIMLRNETLLANWEAAGAMILTTAVGLLLCTKLFRWEKEEKMRPAAKLWLIAVLLPFGLLGTWQIHAKDNVAKTKVLARDLARSRTALIRNARIFVGDGRTIGNGAVLVKAGKIAEVYDGNIPDPKTVNAEPVEAAGKTILPGLIDLDVNLSEPASGDSSGIERALARYLYCGVTAVRGVAEPLDPALRAQTAVNSGQKSGAEFFLIAPDALRAHANGIRRGALAERISDKDFAVMASHGVTYDPMLSAAEASEQAAAGKTDLLNRSLVQQAAPPALLAAIEKSIASRKGSAPDLTVLNIARDNLLRAYRAGVTLVTGTDAGAPGASLIVHGPTVQHELRLWVEAGIPPEVALRAATLNSAQALRAAASFGSIEKGKDATMLIVDGNPLRNIEATEAISIVMFKGEQIDRQRLLHQEPLP